MFNNSFNPSYYDLKLTDIKIDFVEGAYFEIIDPDTGEASYLKISTLIGQETKDVPKVGDYILSEERIIDKSKALVAEPEPKEEVKKSLWDQEIKIDFDSQELCSYDPITTEEVKKALSLAQDVVFADAGIGIDWDDNWLL